MSPSLKRADADYQAAESLVESFSRPRDIASMFAAPQTYDWTLKGALLVLGQPHYYPASDIRFAFQPGPRLREFVRNCIYSEIRDLFARVDSGSIRPGQYAAAKRLLDAVCEAPSFYARNGTCFNIPKFLDNRGILLVEGGGASQQITQIVLGSVLMEVIHYVRTRRRAWPIVLLVLDEATNANLVSAAGHEVRALAECQKMGLDIHILVQLLNFPSSQITDGVLTNCVRHEWYFAASPAVAKKGAEDLGDSEFAATIRQLQQCERGVKDHGNVFFDRVPIIETPFLFPELARVKANRALAAIRNRPEFQSCPENSGNESLNEAISTSVEETASWISSPAKRLRTGL